MKYPKYLSIGYWLFKHIEPELFINKDNPVGGPVPENLYLAVFDSINISKHLRTYEGLIEHGAKEPSDKELLGLIKC